MTSEFGVGVTEIWDAFQVVHGVKIGGGAEGFDKADDFGVKKLRRNHVRPRDRV